jgi:hypothetical protein
MHSGVGLQIHFAQDLREFEKTLSQQKEEHFAAFARLGEIRERAFRLFYQSGDRLSALVFLVARLGFRELRPRDRIVSDGIAHELGKPVRLDATIAINSETMAVYLNRMTVDQHVSLDQREMHVKCFRISSQCGRKVNNG